jgi:hypothetical protein
MELRPLISLIFCSPTVPTRFQNSNSEGQSVKLEQLEHFAMVILYTRQLQKTSGYDRNLQIQTRQGPAVPDPETFGSEIRCRLSSGT